VAPWGSPEIRFRIQKFLGRGVMALWQWTSPSNRAKTGRSVPNRRRTTSRKNSLVLLPSSFGLVFRRQSRRYHPASIRRTGGKRRVFTTWLMTWESSMNSANRVFGHYDVTETQRMAISWDRVGESAVSVPSHHLTQDGFARATTTSCLETTTPPGCSRVMTNACGFVTTSGLRMGMIAVL
jgi:hypothetical protein